MPNINAGTNTEGVLLKHVTTPSTPAAGYSHLYILTGDEPAIVGSAGSEIKLLLDDGSVPMAGNLSSGGNDILTNFVKPYSGATVAVGDSTLGGILSVAGKAGVSNVLLIDAQAITPKISLSSANNRTLYIENSGSGTFGLYVEGPVSVGTTSISAQLHIDQSSATGAQPVLLLDQADDSEEMIEFTGTVGVGNAIEAVGAKTLTTTHFIKITITGVGTRYIPAGTIA